MFSRPIVLAKNEETSTWQKKFFRKKIEKNRFFRIFQKFQNFQKKSKIRFFGGKKFFCETEVSLFLAKTMGRENMVASAKKFYFSSSFDSTCF